MHPIAYSAAYGETAESPDSVLPLDRADPVGLRRDLLRNRRLHRDDHRLVRPLFTGRYPQGLYDFNVGSLRFAARVNGFGYLLTDEWPSFGGDEEPGYPVRLLVEPAKEEYSRMKVLFRIFLLIPVVILSYVMSFILGVVGFIAWLVIVFTGELPEGLYKPLRIASAYMAKALGYHMLVTEDFPPFWMDESEEIGRFGGETQAPAAPAV